MTTTLVFFHVDDAKRKNKKNEVVMQYAIFCSTTRSFIVGGYAE
jgi:hypothetical protein